MVSKFALVYMHKIMARERMILDHHSIVKEEK